MRSVFTYLFFLFVTMVAVNSSKAQKGMVDSLLILLKTDKQDTNSVNHSIMLCVEYRSTGDYANSMQFGTDALILAKQLRYKKGMASAYNNIANIYISKGDYSLALENYFASVKINTEIGNKKGISAAYTNIGTIYFSQNNNKKALEYYFSAAKICEEIGSKKGLAQAYNNIGNLYKHQDKFEMALEKFEASLKIKEEIGDKKGIANCLTNIADVNASLGNYDKAFKYYQTTLEMAKESEDKHDMAGYYYKMGNLYAKLNNIPQARKQHLLSLTLAKELGAKFLLSDIYNSLSFCDSVQGDFKSAFEHFKLYKNYNDSVYTEESTQKTAQMSAQYESEKKDNEIKLLNKDKEKQTALVEAESKKQKIIIRSIGGGLLLVLLFSIFIYNRWRVTQKQKQIIEDQKHLVEEKQKEILDSIYYARRIQTSLLPTEKYITKQLARDHIKNL